MVLYPLETLKFLGVDDILIVTGGNHIGDFADFLGDGSDYGVKLTYKVQKDPGGIAQALALAEDFAHGESIIAVLGDNVFSNKHLLARVLNTQRAKDEACIFVKTVDDPERFGVISKEDGKYSIEEKPIEPKSDKAVIGLYIYPKSVFDVIKTLTPSARGELEITDVNNHYCSEGKMSVVDIEETFWSDCGTPESLARTTRWFLENQ